MKTLIKRIFAGALAVLITVTAIPVTSVSAIGDGMDSPSLEERPQIQRIEFQSKEIIENSHGYYDSYCDDNGEEHKYYRYNEWELLGPYTVVLETGDEVYSEGSGFWYGNYYYMLETATDQSPENHWGRGTHVISVSVDSYQTEVEVNIVESPVADIEIVSKNIVENTRGYMDTMWFDENNTDTWFKYYEHEFVQSFTVIMKNGEVYPENYGSFFYEGEHYNLDILTDQSYYNQWGVGSHKATATLLGCSVEFDVNIVESPIAEIELYPKSVIVETNGYNVGDYVYVEGIGETYVEWYRYNEYDLVGDYIVTLKDGSTVYGSGNGFEYDNEWMQFEITTDQSYYNQWGLGTHKATANLAGAETTFDVNIVASPFERIEVADATTTEMTHGYYSYCYEPDGEEVKWFRYSPENIVSDIKVHLTDGSYIEADSYGFEYMNQYYSFNYSDNQCHNNQWSIGENTYTISVGTLTAEGTVKLVPSKYTSIEIANISTLTENLDGYYDDYSGNFYYDCPRVDLKLTREDGSTYMIYNISEEYIEADRSEWSVGSDNTININFEGKLATGNVTIVPSPEYEYFVQDGGVYITKCISVSSRLEIPSVIEGLPVKGIVDIENDTVREIVIPDSVETILDLSDNWSLENITIGSGVKSLTDKTFDMCYGLQNIYVSEDNPYYSDVDGVVYDKNQTKVIAYPQGKYGNITIPKTAKDIDVLFKYMSSDETITFEDGSEGFIVVDGVIYTSDMKKVVYCAKDKAGTYTMPQTVTEITTGAFKNCRSLTEIKVSNSVTSIAYEAFLGCNSLEKITLPDGLVSIEGAAFWRCENLKDVNIPTSLESIEFMAFMGTLIEEVDFSNNLEFIGPSAFHETGIKELNIPDSVSEIGEYAFSGSQNLTSAIIGSGVSVINDGTFSNCVSLAEVILENESVVIGDGAFANSGLTKINTENIADSIGRHAFSGTYLDSLVVYDSVTDIAYGAFSDCRDLSNIELPETVQSIGGHAFDGTDWYSQQYQGLTYVDTVLYDYKGDMPEGTEVVVKDGTTVIADFAFENDRGLSKITLNNQLKSIGMAAFLECENLTTITIPASVEHIDELAFIGCRGLESIEVDENNEYYCSIDGALYSKDGSELIYCPNQSTDVFVVHNKTKFIKSTAFVDTEFDLVIVQNTKTTIEDIDVYFDDVSIRVDEMFPLFGCYKDSELDKYAQEHNMLVRILGDAPAGLTGDVNGDGVVDTIDASAVISYYYGNIDFDDNQMRLADVNGDGEINTIDASTIISYYYGNIDSFEQ